MRLPSKFERLFLGFHRVWTLALVAAGIAAVSAFLLSCDHRGRVARQNKAAEPHGTGMLEVTLVKGGRPPKVSVDLHWQGDTRPYQWAIHRKRDDEWFSAALVGTVRGSGHTFRDANIESGHTYTYYLRALSHAGYTHIAKASVTVGTPVRRVAQEGLRLKDVK